MYFWNFVCEGSNRRTSRSTTRMVTSRARSSSATIRRMLSSLSLAFLGLFLGLCFGERFGLFFGAMSDSEGSAGGSSASKKSKGSGSAARWGLDMKIKIPGWDWEFENQMFLAPNFLVPDQPKTAEIGCNRSKMDQKRAKRAYLLKSRFTKKHN